MSVLVIILNGYTRENDHHLDNLTHLFDDDYYYIKILDVHDMSEQEQYNIALKCARSSQHKNQSKHSHILIIKDNSISHYDKNIIKHKIQKALKQGSDCYFLCSYQDVCHRFVNIEDDMYHVPYASATQALLIKYDVCKKLYECIKKCGINGMNGINNNRSDISDINNISDKSNISNINNISNNINDGISQLLTHCIEEHQLKCVVFLPNIIEYDLFLATSHADYEKMNRCAAIIYEDECNNNNMIWVILIVILIIFLATLVPYFKYNRYL